MKSITAAFLSSILLMSGIAYAHEIDLNQLDIDKLVSSYNDNLQKVPGFAKKLFGNERINLYVDGKLFVGLAGQNSKIVEYKKGGLDKPTMKIFTTGETISDLTDGQKTLLDAVKDKSIQYQGVGFGNKMKFGFVKIFQGFFIRA